MTTLTSYNPATGKPLGSVPVATDAEIQTTINKATTAQIAWAKLSISQRVDILSKAYKSLEPSAEELSILLAQEMGKDFRRACGEAYGAVRSASYLAQEAGQALQPRKLHDATQFYQPLGVVAVISPWNYPVMMANNLVIPALIAGNTVVLKPSEETPLIADAFFGKLATFLPEGVLNLLHGDGSVGRTLVHSPDIHMIAFTGSLAVGRYIMENGAKNLKRLVMELGGNDAMIVLNDANIEQAARFAVAGGLENTGQMCTSVERVYVDETIADAFITRVIEIAQQYQYGAWDDNQANIGPIINDKQYQKIIAQINDAQSKGATVALGHTQDVKPFIKPTIITGITPSMDIEAHETFGPVIGIATFSNEEDAIARANASELGLGAVVFGETHAQAVAEQLQAGMVGINRGQGGLGGPWVGAKQSGIGFHGTVDGHRQFAQVKVIG